MKEELYTVPVNDAFDAQSECPVCTLYRVLERRAVEFVLGPSYMEDDVRSMTNELGFCGTHLDILLKEKNRLGLAMILKTHLDRQLQETEKFSKARIRPKNLLKNDSADFTGWAKAKESTCFVCAKIGSLYPHYIGTIVYLYKKEADFREKYGKCKGFCGIHAADLIEEGRRQLHGEELQKFYELTLGLYRGGLSRVRDDLDWFAQKFDYRFRDEPWKESKDSIERAAVKTNGLLRDTNA